MTKTIVACVVCLAGLNACERSSSDRTARQKWQVVRAPGTSSCAAVALVYPGDTAHPEQIGVYATRAEAESALERFKTTKDAMTAGDRTICR